MRLKQHVHPLEAAPTRCLQCGGYLCGVVSVVIHHGHAALYATHLEAAVNTGKALEPVGNVLGRHAHLDRHRYGRRCVQRVVPARHPQVEWAP